MRTLGRKFFLNSDTQAVARGLLGKLVVRRDGAGNRTSGMIVETEAYLGIEDRAAHSFAGRRTARNEVTYGRGGFAYVFFIYGMYYQLNFVCGPAEYPHVVLIRALEPIEGVETMRERRGVRKDKDIASGPGKLCIALGIDRSLNGADLNGDDLWVEKFREIPADLITVGKRIGIDYAGEDADRPLRFWITGNANVSRTR